jgi:hypothetical protein
MVVLIITGAQASGLTSLQFEDFKGPLVAPIEVKIVQLDGSVELLNLGGSEGHGGDFKEMIISNLAWDIYSKLSQDSGFSSSVLERLKNTVSNLEVEVVDELSLDGLKRDAINLPSQVKIYLTTSGFRYLSDKSESFSDRAQFLLHELLPLMGKDDSDYKTSSFIADSLRLENEPSQGLYQILYSTHFNHLRVRGGLKFSRAHEICESVKESYQKEYFAVYCTYQEKIHYPYYTDHAYRRFHRNSRRFNSFSLVYGLKVIGLGKLDTLRDRALIDGRISDVPTFSSRAQAMYECTKIVAVQDDHDFAYYKARCEAFAFEDGFRFSILTKNPLIK